MNMYQNDTLADQCCHGEYGERRNHYYQPEREHECRCKHRPGMELARAHVPFQPPVQEMHGPKEGLIKGTVFPELYRPYHINR